MAGLSERDGAYEMQVPLPGFEGKEVEVTATPSEVFVQASAKKEKFSNKDGIVWTEFGSTDIYRRFDVPNPIDVDKVTANLENRLLRISAPEIAKPKQPAAKA
jgi:HSP20 family protein